MVNNSLQGLQLYTSRLFTDIFENKKTKAFIYLLFIAQALFLLLSVKIGYLPDELTHIRFIEFYQHNSLRPIVTEQTSYFELGDITRISGYLYHYLMSLIMRVFGLSGIISYLVMRVISFAMILASLVIFARTAQLLKIRSTITNVALLALTLTSQFLLMSIAVNSDALVILSTSVCIFLAAQLVVNRFTLNRLLALMIFVCVGSITKRTFLPIGLMFTVFIVVLIVKNWAVILAQLRKLNYISLLLIAAFLIIGGLAVERVGYNLYRYHKIEVACDLVHDSDDCREFGVFRRNDYLADNPQNPKLNIFEFMPAWAVRMTKGIVGTQTWRRSAPSSSATVYTFLGLISLSVLGMLRLFKSANDNKSWFIVLSLLGCLVFIIVAFGANYITYIKYGIFGLALQGRYIFPIIIALHIFGAVAIAKILPKKALLVLSTIYILLLVITSGLVVIIKSNELVADPLHPVLIFDTQNSVSQFEPGY